MKQIYFFLLFAFLLSSCVPAMTATMVSTQTTIPASTLTSASTATSIPTATITPSPTPAPLGGGQLLVAFYAFGDCGSCLVIGNFLTGDILLEIPVSQPNSYETRPRQGQIYWSPDGKSILYTEMTADRMNVKLVNLETKQSHQLSDFPSKGGTPEFWNELKLVKWSYDSEYIIYSPALSDGTLIKSYFASKDGVVNSYENRFSDWFPDSRTIFSQYGGTDSYNIETHSFNPVATKILSKLKASFVLQKFILLDREKTKITAIPFPENWKDPLAWQFDTLVSQIFTLAELSPEIKSGEINIDVVEQINDRYISIIGSVNNSTFVKLIDLQNLPAKIVPDDLIQQIGDTPIIVSPDKNYYLLGYCKVSELCSAFDPNWENLISFGWEFMVMGFDGSVQQIPTDLSQFAGITKISANVYRRGNGYLTEGIAFYWK